MWDQKRKGASRDSFRGTDMERKINEFDKVKIIGSGVTGTVVDICTIDGDTIFIVEDDKLSEDKNGECYFKLHECLENELIRRQNKNEKE